MLFYWFNLGVIMLIGIFSLAKVKNLNLILFLIAYLQLYFLVAFRSPTVGTDTSTYLSVFNLTKEFPLMNFDFIRFENGYLFLNKILTFIDSDQLFIAIIGFLPLTLFFMGIWKNSVYPFLSLILFICMGFYADIFNTFRHIIALSIVFVSYSFIINGQLLRFLITISVASLFHVTALIFFPVYFLRNINVNFVSIVSFYSLAVIGFLLGKPIIQFGLNHFSEVNYNISSAGGETWLLILILISVISLVFLKDFMRNYNNEAILFHFIFLAVIFQSIAIHFPLFTRATSYFSMFLILLIPKLIFNINSKSERILSVIIVTVFMCIYYYIQLNYDYNGIIPFHL